MVMTTTTNKLRVLLLPRMRENQIVMPGTYWIVVLDLLGSFGRVEEKEILLDEEEEQAGLQAMLL